jgi:hypothetical protein
VVAKYSPIPHPTIDPGSLRESVVALKEAFEVLSGQKGAAGVAAVTADTMAAAQASTDTAIAAANSASASNAADIAALQSGTVTSIAGNSGAFTLDTTSGIENAGNDIQLRQASSSQFGAVKVDGTTITATGGVISAVGGSYFTSALGADVALNVTANYFLGPSIAQGATGTWLVTGTVTVTDTASAHIYAKLWDGTTVIASGVMTVLNNDFVAIALSGVITNPAGNLRISVRDFTTVNGKILFNASGNSKDSTITAIRIA